MAGAYNGGDTETVWLAAAVEGVDEEDRMVALNTLGRMPLRTTLVQYHSFTIS